MSIYPGVPQGYQNYVGTMDLGYTPIEGPRLSLSLPACESYFGFKALGNPTFDNSNTTSDAVSLLGRIGVISELFGGTYGTSAFVSRAQNDRRYLDPSISSILMRPATTPSITAIAPTFKSLTATDLTFGYQHTADNINVKVNQSSFLHLGRHRIDDR